MGAPENNGLFFWNTEKCWCILIGEFYDLFRAMREIDLIKETKGEGG